MATFTQRSQAASCRGAFQPARVVSRPVRRAGLRVRADATQVQVPEAKAPAVETTASYFTPLYDIEKIKTILPHR
jgi:hypothetical protein